MNITSYQCKICGNTENNNVVIAREMMFGFRDEFKYFKCSFCGCLQIVEYPEDLSGYYPETYYSYKSVVVHSKMLRRIFFDFYWYLNLPLLNLSFLRLGWLQSLQKISKKSGILDVGSGSGRLLQKMSAVGFKNLTGIDPFIEKDINYQSGVRIIKTDVYGLLQSVIEHKSINKSYELIMLHHSFEHMDNPRETLNQLYQLLTPEGQLLIRIPVSDSFAWRKYGNNWVQLDAPRHFFLHTTKSIALLADDCGFILKNVVYDSSRRQFTGSEKYCREITFFADCDFPSSYIRMCKKQAAYLNKMRDGDQACFVLVKR